MIDSLRDRQVQEKFPSTGLGILVAWRVPCRSKYFREIEMDLKTNSQRHWIPEHHNEMERSLPFDIRTYSHCPAGEECDRLYSWCSTTMSPYLTTIFRRFYTDHFKCSAQYVQHHSRGKELVLLKSTSTRCEASGWIPLL